MNLPDLLIIEATRKTPEVTLDPSGSIKIQGRSIPEDASLFFKRVIEWIDEYIALGRETTTVDLLFEYLNSGTSKHILQILKTLKETSKSNHKLIINWYYENGDDDILERGEYYATILDLKINLIETE